MLTHLYWLIRFYWGAHVRGWMGLCPILYSCSCEKCREANLAFGGQTDLSEFNF